MFFIKSRYKKLDTNVLADASGRLLASKELRLLPHITGIFYHTIEETDRLDNLSFKYYKQPKKWWRICDANPEVHSPQALLGKEPFMVNRFILTVTDHTVYIPWAKLRKDLTEQIGVENVILEESISLISQAEIFEDQSVNINAEQYQRAVIITFNTMNITSAELVNIITNAGFEVSQTTNIERIGKELVIPPDIVG